MTNTTQYTLRRLPIDNLVYDELGKEVFARNIEEFRGTAVAITHLPYFKGDTIAFANSILTLNSHQILHQLTCGRIQVVSPVDFVRYWNAIPDRDVTSAHTNTFAILPDGEGDLRTKVLQAFGMKETKVPLLVQGLKPVRANTSRGFTVERTDITTLREAPYLTLDCEVKYDPKTDDLVPVQEGERGVRIWVPDEKADLCKSFRIKGRDIICFSNGIGYLEAYLDDRLQVTQKDRSVC